MTYNDVVIRKKIKGNKRNFQREASIDVWPDGVVRIQEGGGPYDVVLLTAHQVAEIARLSAKARGQSVAEQSGA